MAEYSFSRSQRSGEQASLIYFDLDRFKQINDQHGHQEGDEALRIFADTMSEQLRSSDVYARLGGDEFVALVTGEQHDAAEEIIARLCQQLQQTAELKNKPYQLSFSYGVVTYQAQRHRSIEALLEEADQAMYQHKQSPS